MDHIMTHAEQLSDAETSGQTAAFWYSFLEMMGVFFAFVRAIKIGNWELHLESTQKMLPWFFAYDRQNYSRFLTYYWGEMKNLPETHPNVHREFM